MLLLLGVASLLLTPLLGGVPENIVRYLEGQLLLHIAHAAFGCFRPWALRGTVVPLSVIVPDLAWVLCVAFRLCAHNPLASLTMSLRSCTLALLSWRALGQDPRQW
jgi:hypothetical protein